jgi:hypothetical protein
MPDAIHTQIATDLQVSDTPQPQVELPADIQYMPPGRHTINATRNKQPVTVAIFIDKDRGTNLASALDRDGQLGPFSPS